MNDIHSKHANGLDFLYHPAGYDTVPLNVPYTVLAGFPLAFLLELLTRSLLRYHFICQLISATKSHNLINAA